MRCPKCGFFGPDSLDTCKKCGKDLSLEKEKLGLFSYRVHAPQPKPLLREDRSSRQRTIEDPLPPPSTWSAPLSDQMKASQQSHRPAPTPAAQEPSRKDKKNEDDHLAPLGGVESRAPAEPSFETVREDFSFSPADGDTLGSAPLEKTFDTETRKETPRLGQETLDDFEFPTMVRSDIPEAAAWHNDEPATSSFSGSEAEFSETLSDNESTGKPLGEETRRNKEAGRGRTIGEDRSRLGQFVQDDEGKTAMLTAEEIEQILKSGDAYREGQEIKRSSQMARTEFLSEDEISKLLESIDNKARKPD